MVKYLDDLDKALLGKRNDHVASSEAGMDTPIDGLYSKFLRQALRRRFQPIRLGGVRNVVNSHTVIVTLRQTGPLTGVRFAHCGVVLPAAGQVSAPRAGARPHR